MIVDILRWRKNRGISIRLDGPHIHYAYPVAVLAATRP
jgi:hypothetical protein